MSSDRAESAERTPRTVTNPNSALYWQPKIQAAIDNLPVSVPETEFVEYEFTESFGLLEGEVSESLPWGEFVAAVESVGWPAFVRTDQKSVKHAGPGAYKAIEPDDIPTIVAVLTDHHVKTHRHPGALMVREWVNINTSFRAFDGLPIGRELRVFARPDRALCDHFYWPESAIEDGRGTPTALDSDQELETEDWRHRLRNLRAIDGNKISRLRDVAKRVTERLNEPEHIPDELPWSVDFAEASDGEWWLIDVAVGEDSWHLDCVQKEVIESGE